MDFYSGGTSKITGIVSVFRVNVRNSTMHFKESLPKIKLSGKESPCTWFGPVGYDD